MSFKCFSVAAKEPALPLPSVGRKPHFQRSSIRACAVLVVDDTEWGKRPVLFVEPVETGEFNEQDMAAYLKTRLPKIKIPEKIISLNRLPRAAIGKIDYTALRELYQKKHSS